MGIHKYRATKQLDVRMVERLKWNPDAICWITGRRYPVCNKIIRCGNLYFVEQQGEVVHSYYALMNKDALRACDCFQEVTLKDWLNIDKSYCILETSTSLNQHIIAILNIMVDVLPPFITIHKGSNFSFEVDEAGNYSVEIEIYGMLDKSRALGDDCWFYEYDDDGDAIMRTV